MLLSELTKLILKVIKITVYDKNLNPVADTSESAKEYAQKEILGVGAYGGIIIVYLK